jgi:WD40 repeat protein
LLAAAQAAGIQVFDPATGTLRGRLSGHTGTVFALAFSRDGLYLASGSEDTTARLWRVS